MIVNKRHQTITYADGCVHCDAFSRYGHGTHVRVTLKDFEAKSNRRNNAARRRQIKNDARRLMLEKGGVTFI